MPVTLYQEMEKENLVPQAILSSLIYHFEQEDLDPNEYEIEIVIREKAK